MFVSLFCALCCTIFVSLFYARKFLVKKIELKVILIKFYFQRYMQGLRSLSAGRAADERPAVGYERSVYDGKSQSPDSWYPLSSLALLRFCKISSLRQEIVPYSATHRVWRPHVQFLERLHWDQLDLARGLSEACSRGQRFRESKTRQGIGQTSHYR